MLDYKTYCIYHEGGIEALEGFWVNVVIDRVFMEARKGHV